MDMPVEGAIRQITNPTNKRCIDQSIKNYIFVYWNEQAIQLFSQLAH